MCALYAQATREFCRWGVSCGWRGRLWVVVRLLSCCDISYLLVKVENTFSSFECGECALLAVNPVPSASSFRIVCGVVDSDGEQYDDKI